MTSSAINISGPLRDLLIIDLSRVLAGPYATMVLSDLGALNFNDVLDFLPSTARYQSNEGDVDNNGQRTGTPCSS